MKGLCFFSVAAAILAAVPFSQAEVRFLGQGHTDLGVEYSAATATWNLHVGSESLGAEYAPDEVVLEVNPAALGTVPADPRFAFLGGAGDSVWILPAAETEELLYLGFGGEGIPEGVFTGNQVKMSLKAVTGPGEFFSYREDAFGKPEVLFSTRDGIGTNDVATVLAGGETHLAWAFTQPGQYAVTVEGSGTLVSSGKLSSSGPVTYTFSVVKPVVPLTVEHVDLRVLYDPTATNALNLVIRDGLHQVNYQTNETVLVVGERGKLLLPSGTPFGPEGAPLWVLPQSQDPSLLYLGTSADGIAPNFFTGPLTFRLRTLEGPGQFFLWQAGQGGLEVQMNSADGLSEADSHPQIVGSHAHFNWGFTTNGVYRLTFDVSGQPSSQTTRIQSPLSTFTFHVLPLPTNAPPARVELVDPKLTGRALSFNVLGAAGRTVDIQSSGDFKQWSVLTNLVLTTSPAPVTIPVDATRVGQFLRVLAQ